MHIKTYTQQLIEHEDYIKQKGFKPIMTLLIGSQNYNLETPNSDIDTFTFILPTIEELARGDAPKSGEYEVENGKCMYKDIRLALNLLKKTSPNSVECFYTRYRIFPSQVYGLYDFLKNDSIFYANYTHMVGACAGMAHQLTKRNMSAGKRYSHSLRLKNLVNNYIEHRTHLMFYLPLDEHIEALAAKNNQDPAKEDYYNSGCELISNYLDEIKASFAPTKAQLEEEKYALNLIEQFQVQLVKEYLKYEVSNGN